MLDKYFREPIAIQLIRFEKRITKEVLERPLYPVSGSAA
jgi:hypothetical protein